MPRATDTPRRHPRSTAGHRRSHGAHAGRGCRRAQAPCTQPGAAQGRNGVSGSSSIAGSGDGTVCTAEYGTHPPPAGEAGKAGVPAGRGRKVEPCGGPTHAPFNSNTSSGPVAITVGPRAHPPPVNKGNDGSLMCTAGCMGRVLVGP